MSSNDLLIGGHSKTLARDSNAGGGGSAPVRQSIYTLARGVDRIPTLRALLDDFEVRRRPSGRHAVGDCVLAWGMRPSAMRAKRYAEHNGLAIRYIEDGFLRSVGLGRDDPPLSIVFDDLGLYLDASGPSRLEALVRKPLTETQLARTRALIQAWQESKVSKYNHSRDLQGGLPTDCVLVVDQTLGDASIACGNASHASFMHMLKAAMSEYPQSTILVKVHPDVIAGRKKGHYDLASLRTMPRVKVLDSDVHPASLFRSMRAVYSVTSQLGFEALLWEVPVRVFGMPFYAGWGLTKDELPSPARRCPVRLEQLVHATLVDYCRYVNPETGQRCEIETVIAWMGLQRRMRERFSPSIEAIGFSGWKRGYVRDYFAGSVVRFCRWSVRAPAGGVIATWGRNQDHRLKRVSPTATVVRVEDGFLRSVGLGADLTRPLSWVQDDVGLYYDATRPSRLEQLLRDTQFSAELLTRAALLRLAICTAGITKYNLHSDGGSWSRPKERRVVLVPGQVETDASIRYGTTGIRDNMALLRAVRLANPNAYIVYKPHPDVVAGLRKAGRAEDRAKQWCDEIVGPVPLSSMLDSVDEVHVLTSLAGFEALLRRVPVVTYGQPFYAGWGLSRDLCLTEAVRTRRCRELELDELVAGALILYPTYVSRLTYRYTTPEQVLRELIEWRAAAGVPRWRHWIARLFREA